MSSLQTCKTVNSVTLLGKISRAPELKKIVSGRRLVVFSLQTENDEKYSSSEFHNIVVWDELSEIPLACNIEDTLYVEGTIKTRHFLNKQNVKVFKTEIIAQKIIILDKKNNKTNEEEVIDESFFTATKQDFYTS